MSVIKINIDELNKEREDKISLRKKTYEDILKKCHNKIKLVSKSHNNMGVCFFNVPRYSYGLPLYDQYSCISYLVNALITNGFDVKYTHPNLLFISWLGKSNSKEKTNTLFNNNNNKKNYKSIDEFRPSNTLIYNNDQLNLFKNKTKFLEHS
jgi:hypothetical protein